ncbi:unnamed protein product [Paramecium pentaurelia]|uniref:F-box domain-containing protein n=1 Tax=Paramecium pentaurelia TaxID=43138 RepID=A0A8S1XQ77_9CILI|nr:unnamed protein product [Paramecium pentaurelia]
MLQTLQNELNNLQTKGKQQELRIENLYINFNEIYHLQNNLNNPTSTKHNMLYQVRPEVFHQILIFLDTKQLLQFRLISSRANQVVKLMLPKQINIVQQLINDQQNELQLKIQSAEEIAKDQNYQQLLNTALNGLQQLNKAHIVELKSLARPTELIERIMNLICMILDPSFKIQKDSWKECQKYLGRQNFIEQILTLDINNINDKQFQQLQQVDSIEQQQAAAQSIAASSMLSFLKAVLEVRQSKLYITQNAIKQLESKIKKEKQLIQKLEKIIQRE